MCCLEKCVWRIGPSMLCLSKILVTPKFSSCSGHRNFEHAKHVLSSISAKFINKLLGMKMTANSIISVYQRETNVKCDILTCTYSITYARMRMACDLSYSVNQVYIRELRAVFIRIITIVTSY